MLKITTKLLHCNWSRSAPSTSKSLGIFVLGLLAVGLVPATGQDNGAATSAKPAMAPQWVREPIGGDKSGKFLRVADTRGMGDAVAALLALETSGKNSVILLVQGNNPKIIADAKRELNGLILGRGYDRLGLVIGDGPQDTAYIYSKGHKVTTLTKVATAENRDIVFASDVEALYERDVLVSPR